MSYYLSKAKVTANRDLLKEIAQALAEGRTLTMSLADDADISRETLRLREIIASAAAYPEESYDQALHGSLRIKQDVIAREITLEPKVSAEYIRTMALKGRSFNDAIKAWSRLERADEQRLEIVVDFRDLEEAQGFIAEVKRVLGWECIPDVERSDGNKIHLDCTRIAQPKPDDRALELFRRAYGSPQG